MCARCDVATPAPLPQVRQDKTAIDFSLLREAIDKRRLGLPSARLPPSEAKLRMATVQAARAVAVCTTTGLPPVVHVSIQPRGGVMSRIVFMPQVRPVRRDLTPVCKKAEHRVPPALFLLTMPLRAQLPCAPRPACRRSSTSASSRAAGSCRASCSCPRRALPQTVALLACRT